MSVYRKKPEEVEAFALWYVPGPEALATSHQEEWPEWFRPFFRTGNMPHGQSSVYVYINGMFVLFHGLRTHELFEIEPGDYIVKQSDFWLNMYKRAEFEKQYESGTS